MKNNNKMTLTVQALSKNESFARSTVAGFVAHLNPTVEEIGDIKTAVSEAVTNCIVHGYDYGEGEIVITTSYEDRMVTVKVADKGRGIVDIGKALQPFYTSRPHEERSGMGFTVMQAFCNEIIVTSVPGEGTCVTLKKVLIE
jgi:stage II sporulation protein AB (anti-sigma F factor)